jgi:hypothetical protein
MNQLDDQHNIDEMRRRLYSRGEQFKRSERHGVSDIKVDVSRNWDYGTEPEETSEPPSPDTPNIAEATTSGTTETPTRSRRYRWYVLLGSLCILLITAIGSGAYLFYGGNQISSDNITLDINGPNTLGGGERMDAQIAITNQNSVPIESATLIVSYPAGSQTVAEPIENLFERRIMVDRLEPGEARNVPIQALVFGEEGDEKRIAAQLEYSIENSDSLFYKDAEPHNFRIISSPVVLQVESIRRVASGQEVEVEISATANTGQSFEDLLVTASYPQGFTYLDSSREPTFNQNVWRIDELEPEETETITVRGTVAGLAEETLRLTVSVGPSLPDNPFRAGATLVDTYTEFVIERPFIDVVVEVNGQTSSPAILEAGSAANIEVTVTNTLPEPVYDMVVEIVPRGSIINTASIQSTTGFYDSNTGVIRYEAGTVPGLRELAAGDDADLSLRIDPNTTVSTASFTLDVSVFGKRLGERNAQEQLFGTSEVEARYASVIDARNALQHVSGPIPPVVGEETVYQVTLSAAAGNNEITNGVMTTLLPVYVEWLENYQADGAVTYNPISRELRWEVGSIAGAREKDLRFTLAYTPSDSQVNSRPILVNQQVFEATDRFTGTPQRVTVPQMTTALGSNGDIEEGTGLVQASE